MAPIKNSRKGTSGGKGSKGPSKPIVTGLRNKVSKRSKPAPPVQQKTKSKSAPAKRKRKVYTDKELGLPKLNTITPVGVDLPKGKKKGKVFVDDQESMMTILAIVNASKEGEIESKMMKSRHMEEIREARRKETEKRQEQKKSKLDDTKDSLRRKRKRKLDGDGTEAMAAEQDTENKERASRKQVSFA